MFKMTMATFMAFTRNKIELACFVFYSAASCNISEL